MKTIIVERDELDFDAADAIIKSVGLRLDFVNLEREYIQACNNAGKNGKSAASYFEGYCRDIKYEWDAAEREALRLEEEYR